MNKRILSLALLLLLLISAYVPIARMHEAEFPPGYDFSNLIIDSIAEPETLDPAWASDATSREVTMNVYETLIFYATDWDAPETASQAPGPYSAGRIDEFIPLVASALPTIEYFDPPQTSPQGLPIYSRWTFPIRTGVEFHFSSNTLTPADVEYSFERALVQDRTGGSSWMLYEPLLGTYRASPPSGLPPEQYDIWGPPDDNFGLKIDYAVQSDADNVYFYFANLYPELAFKQILAQSWAGIVHKEWAINEGDLDVASVSSGWSNWYDIWLAWHDPAVSFLEDAISHTQKDGGEGPYQYDYWTPGTGYSVVKFDDYWQGWPAPLGSVCAIPGARLPGYVERVTWNYRPAWIDRRDRFLAGDSDYTFVPRVYRDVILGQTAADEEWIRCFYRTWASGRGILTLALDAFFFTLDISPSTTYVGNAKGVVTVSNASIVFDSDGAPYNIFGIDPITGIDEGLNVRKGFAYAFDYAWYISTINLNEGQQPSDPVIRGLAYDNPVQAGYNSGLSIAEYYLRLAWGGVDNPPFGPPWRAEDVTGALWNNGMQFTVAYNTGNVAREMAANEIVNKINNLNPGTFNLVAQGLSWGSVYLPAMVASELPLFINGWQADFADPHDFAFPFQHSQGIFSSSQRYENPVVDALIEAAIATADDTTPYDNSLDASNPIPLMDNVGPPPEPYGSNWRTWPTSSNSYLTTPLDVNYPRRSLYYALQEIYYEEVSSVPLVQVLMRHFEQPWMRGWYYNPLYGGSVTPGIDSTTPSTPAIYVYHVWKSKTHYGDVNWDGEVDLYDAIIVSSSWTGPPKGPAYFRPQADLTGGIGGTTGGLEGGVMGIPNGAIEFDDLALVSAYWDEPYGVAHP